MSKELVVSSTPHETRVAIVEDDRLSEVYVERASEHAIAGGIYKGRINRVLPGMQSAFVKIGLERDAFLYVTDIVDETEQIESGELDAVDEVMPDAKPAPSPAKKDASGDIATDQESAAESSEEGSGEKRRRRGRRSRRRRGRSNSNFPDAKFAELDKSEEAKASEDTPQDDAAAQDAAAAESEEAPTKIESHQGFELLPGESIAKYDPVDVAETDEEVAQVEADAEEPDEDISAEEEVEPEVEEPTESNDSDEAAEQEAEVEASNDSNADTSEDDSVAAEASTEEEDPTDEDESGADEGQSEDQAADRADTDEASDTDSESDEEEKSEPTEASVRDRNDSQPLRTGRRGRRRRGRGSRRREEGDRTKEDSVATADSTSEETPTASGKESKSSPKEEPGTRISDLIKPGQEIIVQVAKEPLGRKGARITSHVALPGRYVVYMPTVAHTGISRKIGSDAERNRLRRIIKDNSDGVPGGFIVRTAGQGAEEADLIADLTFLANLWKGIQEKAEKRPAPALLHADLDIVERILRDHLGKDYKTIWVDSEAEYERVVRFVERFQPDLLDRVKLYTRSTPIFDEFNITQELEKALRPKVWLKSGGYLVINQTEALVAIDVNTGKYVGKSDRLEDTIVKTNLEAAEELVRQMKLRDLGGIIVVDFIDMEDRGNRKKVGQALDDALRADRAPSKVLGFNDFGLVCITRKRVKQSLERALCSPCPSCQGAGHVPSVPTVIYDLLGNAQRMGKREHAERGVVIRCNPDIGKELKARSNSYLQELEEILGASVLIKSDVTLARENFDID